MFKLTSKLAFSNLKQNRKLYYPFALAVILTTMILYSFIALASTPHLEDSYGGGRRELYLVLVVSSSSWSSSFWWLMPMAMS